MPRRAPLARDPRMPPRLPPSFPPRVMPPGWTHATVPRILARDPVCYLCHSAPSTDVDHVIPRWRGGTDTDDNLAGACHPCHDRKTQAESRAARAASALALSLIALALALDLKLIGQDMTRALVVAALMLGARDMPA